MATKRKTITVVIADQNEPTQAGNDEAPLMAGLRRYAETEGFEPSVPIRGLHLSRVVH